MNEIERENDREAQYDDWAAERYLEARRVTCNCPGGNGRLHSVGTGTCDARPRCRYYRQGYCPDHDYDHVLERRERAIDGGPLTYETPLGDDFNARWAEYKNEFAAREREQEERAFEAKMERDRQLGW